MIYALRYILFILKIRLLQSKLIQLSSKSNSIGNSTHHLSKFTSDTDFDFKRGKLKMLSVNIQHSCENSNHFIGTD